MTGVAYLASHADGVILTVRAQPGARRNCVVGPHGAALKVAVMAPPDKGRANDALLKLLSEVLAIPQARLELISGPHSRDKKVLLKGMTLAGVAAVLAKAFV